jgi:hypothetical protein
VTEDFSGGKVVRTNPNPQPRGPQPLPLTSLPSVALPGVYIPASISLRIVGGPKLPLRDKAVFLEDGIGFYLMNTFSDVQRIICTIRAITVITVSLSLHEV